MQHHNKHKTLTYFFSRFAFAETDSIDEIEKAKNSMEGVEIQGRKLRVRRLDDLWFNKWFLLNTKIVFFSSKDTDKKKRNEIREPAKPKEPLKKDDVKLHLVTAFVAFLGREIEAESSEDNERFRGLIDTAKSALVTAYNLPEDDSLTVPRNIEDIFFRDVRNDVKIEKPEPVPDVKQEKVDEDEDEEMQDDDDGNWKRKSRGDNDEDGHEETRDDNNVDNVEEEHQLSEEGFVNDLVSSECTPIDEDLLVNV